ncbi:MAG: carbamate kinase [Desulfovibrio sp.]|uniref:carbamate kinase n=1 Tax=Desulfovibrio sp. 7SRBS1 TaxID=3378064 RepID=UPI003B400B44
MRVIVALGGNALLQRGQAMNTETQRANVRVAASALAKVAQSHELIISHGNGPQVGLLALQAEAMSETPEDWPLDVLGAQTEGMIGYLIEQEMGNCLPQRGFATLLTQVQVDAEDKAFADPEKFIGPVYTEAAARELAEKHGWAVKPDGEYWRRVVPSPRPKRIFELDTIKILLENDIIVICAGGGGIPTMYGPDGNLHGVEAVIDKDRLSSLLAKELNVDVFVMLTDVRGVYTDWGKPGACPLRSISPADLEAYDFASGSMGPKIESACEFVRATGKRAAIGSLCDLEDIVAGKAGTSVVPDCPEPVWYSVP